MKKIFLLMIGVMLLLSCKQATYYQVYEMRSDDVKTTANNLLYENEDCSVTYNLWARGGRVSFMIYNKTDKNLFVVMPKSFFIMNDVANDYYSESVYGSSVTTMSSASTYGGATVSGYMSKANSWYPKTLSRGYTKTSGLTMTKSVQTKENQFVCVPPKSAKFIDGFNIYDKLYLDCGNAKHNYPKKTSEVIYYDQSTTPKISETE